MGEDPPRSSLHHPQKEDHRQPGIDYMQVLVLNLELKIAFDWVSHQYLFRVLQKKIVSLKGFLGDITSKIHRIKHLSNAVGLHCGVHQGCL